MSATFSVSDTRHAATCLDFPLPVRRYWFGCSVWNRLPKPSTGTPAVTTAAPTAEIGAISTAASIGLRSDLDMHNQLLEVAILKQIRHEAQVQSWREDSALTPSQKITALKMMITEAERYQREHKLPYLRETILERLNSPRGRFKRMNLKFDLSVLLKEKSAASMICSDIDAVMKTPLHALPQGVTPVQAAAKAVRALPLWRCGPSSNLE